MSTTTSTSPWQDIKKDLISGVTSYTSHLSFGDFLNDNDFKLASADLLSNKLKIFKQESLLSETSLQQTPTAILSFYSSDSQNKNATTCYLAVAGGCYIFIYKNLKGTDKLLIPNIDVNQLEIQVWEDLKQEKIDCQLAVERLEGLAKSKISLSTRSLDLLYLKDEVLISTFITERKAEPIIMLNYIVYLTLIKKVNQFNAHCNLVIGSEGGNIFIVDPSISKIISKHKLDSTPSLISTYGTYESEYRIHVACRNGMIFTIRNGELLKTSIQIGSTISGLIRYDKGLYVSSMNNYYSCYSPIGDKLFSVKLPSKIIGFDKFESERQGFKGVILLLSQNEVRLYNEKQLISVIVYEEKLISIKSGRFGRYDECFVVVTEKGGLYIKSLLQSVVIDSLTYNKRTSVVNDEKTRLDIPKKTTLYLDLIEREKESYSSMHDSFQNDIIKMKYKALDTYVRLLSKGHAPQNYSTISKIKLNVSINGLGPVFRLSITIDNSGEEPVSSSDLLVDYEKEVFSFQKEYIQLGILMPNVPTKYSLMFRCISETGVSGTVKICVVDRNSAVPLIVNRIKVPISELEI